MKTAKLELTQDEVNFLLWMLGYTIAAKEHNSYVRRHHDAILPKVGALQFELSKPNESSH